jgi:hypothetical protein
MRKHDIIEIVTTDENCRKHLRRVRVATFTQDSDAFYITGENLQGKFPKRYELPKQPIAGKLPTNVPNYIGWFPFDNSGQADE